MSDLSGTPYIEVQVDKNGLLDDAGDPARVVAFVHDNRITDLVLISHGWNNNMPEARKLYGDFFASVRAVLDGGFIDLGNRRIGAIGILWPSKKFTDIDLIPGGGAASVGGDQPRDDVARALDSFADLLDDAGTGGEIEVLRGLIDDLDESADARARFADCMRGLLPASHADPDDGSDRFLTTPADQLFERLKPPLLPQAPGRGGGAAGGVMGGVMGGVSGAGGAAGLGDWFGGFRAAARRMLNYATYYLMKARAGTVGAGGVREVVVRLKAESADTKVHMVGHSFGGRVVTAAAKALADMGGPSPSTVSLLQAAFSHNGFARDFHAGRDGHFRSVVERSSIEGPLLVTHTHNDRANGLAYPLASRVAGQDAAAVGGPGDRFGAIGANGAQHTPEALAQELLEVGGAGYAFQVGRVYNLNADRFIKDHGDVTGPEVTYAVLSAISTT